MTASLQDNWTILASHGLVLIWFARHCNSTLSEAAHGLGLTERRIASIVKDLDTAGYLQRRKVGRCNTYSIVENARFRHPIVANLPIRVLLNPAPVDPAIRDDEHGFATLPD